MSISDLPGSIIVSLHSYCYVPQSVSKRIDLDLEQQWCLINTWLKWLCSEGWLTPMHQVKFEDRDTKIDLNKLILYETEIFLPKPVDKEINTLFQIYTHHVNSIESAQGRHFNRRLLSRAIEHGLEYVPLFQDVIWLGGSPKLSCLDLFDEIVKKTNPQFEAQIIIPVLVTATSNKYWLTRASLTALISNNGRLLRLMWQNSKIIRDDDYYVILVGALQQYFNNHVIIPGFYVDLQFLLNLVLSKMRSVDKQQPLLSINFDTNAQFWSSFRPLHNWMIENVPSLPRPLPYSPSGPELRWRLLQEWLTIDHNLTIALKSKRPVQTEIRLSDLSNLGNLMKAQDRDRTSTGVGSRSRDSLSQGISSSTIDNNFPTTVVSELDPITNKDFQLLWEIYQHEVQRGSDEVGLDTDFLEHQIIQGLKYRPFLARISYLYRWWPSKLIALITEIEDFEELQSRLNIKNVFPVTEWESVYPTAFLGINNLSSETLWSAFATLDGKHQTLEAINALEIYLQSSNITESQYLVLLEQLGFNYGWSLLCSLYSNNYHLLKFVLVNQKNLVRRDTKTNNMHLDQTSWSRLIMRNQAIGFLNLIFAEFSPRHVGPRIEQSLYSGLLSALFSMLRIDLRVCDLLIQHNFENWIVNFIVVYGGYFPVKSIILVLEHMSPQIRSTIFDQIQSDFKLLQRKTHQSDRSLGPRAKTRVWRPEDLLELMGCFQRWGHQLNVSNVASRSDQASVSWVLTSLKVLGETSMKSLASPEKVRQNSLVSQSGPNRKRKRSMSPDPKEQLTHRKKTHQ
jgi:hypothetical protein